MPHPLQTLKDLFHLGPEQLEAIEQMFVERSFVRGDVIDGRHSLKTQIFYLKSGAARVYYTEKGREHTIQFAFDDEYLDTKNDVAVQTTVMFMEDSKVIYMPMAGIRDFLSDQDKEMNQEAILFMNASLISRIKILEERIFYTQHASAVERYNWVISRYPRLLECATVTQIASFLGVTKETLYRIRSGKY